ncbi:prolyl oligopeptidase family serine peptidase [Luteolibacter marinus]|uniref:prolyl oligopeptidase family serine peptidase n=1 Tax=Luteolibacter marinus TaxID=2776705 RepID=UPI001866E9E0|nr:prolyl oligopeptidase family serine peptidase [Luteolibacter marinus]
MKACLLATLLVSTGLLPGRAGEVRTWKTADGSKAIDAEYVGSRDDKVTIRRVDNRKLFTIPLASLSEDDRKWVEATLATAAEEAAKADKSSPFAKLLTGEWERTEGHGLQYRIFGARKLRGADEEGYPLVIYLHGRGGDVMTPEQPGEARTFTDEAQYRKHPCIVIAPQCTEEGSWDGNNADAVIDIVGDLVKKLSIDKNRIYLTGYSMGGYGTFYLLGKEPKLFAAGIPVSGGGNPNTAEEFKKVPVWVFHGAKDPTVKPEQSQRMVEALEKARGNVKYTEFPDGDHGIAGRVYNDPEVHEWLFEQKR